MADLAVVVERLGDIFAECDRDGNGAVNKRELIQACRSSPEIAEFWGLPSVIQQEDGSRDAMELIFQEIDGDADRQITWTEFLDYHLKRASQTMDRPQPPTETLPPAIAACEPVTAREHLETPRTPCYFRSGAAVDRGDDSSCSLPHTVDAFSTIPNTGLATCVGKETDAGGVHSRLVDGGAIQNGASSAFESRIAGRVVPIGGAKSDLYPNGSSALCIPNCSSALCVPDSSSALCIPNVTGIWEYSHHRWVNPDPYRSRSSAIRLPVSSCQEHISRCWIKFECLDAKYTGPSSAGRLADVRWAIEFK
eukprot:CAMPEP_0115253634 /NCGR_PEP_ID=MMETSP0270-20121206/44775_1 /TAXON_ID=71861 /ORGANISM="Scrippsiella trochoidea, Strain CCMP3099" /LENGTH=307 /DNA_ID=CAMNT_0002669149 /DNA_START=35 /DNA_END=954 /DNA_ORIENTATION=+